MKTFTLILALLAPLVFASVDPPGSIVLIRPEPKTHVPQNTNLTFGFASPSQQFFGLIQNVKMSYNQPDGTTVQSGSFGPAITQGGTFQTDGYSPAQCRSYPGVSTTTVVNASQVGNYTFIWDVTYVESSDSSKANETYCGPPPFSKQNWNVNSTVTVIDVTVGSAAVAPTATTTSPLPSKPTGKVNSNAFAIQGNVANWGSALGMLVGLGMVV